MNQQVVFTVTFVAGLFAGMLLLLEVGRRVGIRHKHDKEEEGAGFGAVEGAVFGLLATRHILQAPSLQIQQEILLVYQSR